MKTFASVVFFVGCSQGSFEDQCQKGKKWPVCLLICPANADKTGVGNPREATAALPMSLVDCGVTPL